MRAESRAVSLGDDLERLALARRVGEPPELERLDEHPDRRERRAQVVRDLVHEVGLELRDPGLAVDDRERGGGARRWSSRRARR